MTREGHLWPWGLGLVLAVTMAGNLWVMHVARSDASFAVEPDYYRRALAWDSTRAQEARNATLGWQLEADLVPTGDGRARLEVQLRDAAGTPVTGATVAVEATHNARAADIVRATLDPGPWGGYSAELAAARRGLWQLRFEVSRGTERFTATLRRDTSRGPAAP